ncbi:MAG: 6-carboxytetrahydropterin synthase [Pseudomonadales bacterium]|nr:6-carboxytetrahydropterin synthase [Pseudomonadales bacterium]
MYTVAVSRDFIARHYLIGGDWGRENQPHAHHYVVQVRIEGEQLDVHGYLVDIVAIESALDAIVAEFGDSMLNDKAEFTGLNPSIEHFSRIICEKLLAGIKPPGSGSLSVKLWENDSCWAAFRQNF